MLGFSGPKIINSNFQFSFALEFFLNHLQINFIWAIFRQAKLVVVSMKKKLFRQKLLKMRKHDFSIWGSSILHYAEN